jgi:hypothetical protein
MKGIVFNLLEQLVARDHGEDTWDALLDASGLDGVYPSLGSYPDEEFRKLVGAASDELGMSPDDVIVWLGRNSVPLFAVRYPQLFEPHASTRSFVLTLNDIIHPEVRKLYPGADVPEFDFDARDGTLLMGYRSFVMHLGAGEDDRAIVRAIAAMATALGLEVVAEGVETAGQAAEVHALGCGSAQGYHFARPMPAAEIESRLSVTRSG